MMIQYSDIKHCDIYRLFLINQHFLKASKVVLKLFIRRFFSFHIYSLLSKFQVFRRINRKTMTILDCLSTFFKFYMLEDHFNSYL